MLPTLVRLSKASKRPLTPKRGNKDFYKGTRQGQLPGSHATGAPGRHVVRGKAKYILDDEKVRVFVAPPVEAINDSPLKPYVDKRVRLTRTEKNDVFGKLPKGGLDGQVYYKIAPRVDRNGVIETPDADFGAVVQQKPKEKEGDNAPSLSLGSRPQLSSWTISLSAVSWTGSFFGILWEFRNPTTSFF